MTDRTDVLLRMVKETQLPITVCRHMTWHLGNLMLYGRCGCWDEGRNLYPYWGYGKTNNALFAAIEHYWTHYGEHYRASHD